MFPYLSSLSHISQLKSLKSRQRHRATKIIASPRRTKPYNPCPLPLSRSLGGRTEGKGKYHCVTIPATLIPRPSLFFLSHIGNLHDPKLPLIPPLCDCLLPSIDHVDFLYLPFPITISSLPSIMGVQDSPRPRPSHSLSCRGHPSTSAPS
jgi:hypothetical protein